MEENIQKRKSNFELLRIVAIAMIVGLYLFNGNMGGTLAEQQPRELNYYITYLFESMFFVSVNIFVLLTGYFNTNKDFISISKPLNLFLQMTFYGLLHYSVALIFGLQSLSLKGFGKSVFPYLYGLKWFIVTYIILYFFIPFINVCINNINQKSLRSLIILITLFYSIWPCFFSNPPEDDRGYGIINFILLYLIGSYLRKYYKGRFYNQPSRL